MIGNGWANIVAAVIIAAAIVWSAGQQKANRLDEKQIAEMYARAVGDIRNDVVVNCGCCGEGQGKRAEAPPF